VEVLREAPAGKGIGAALVFGSVARGGEGAASDVDLMVVAGVGLKTVSGRLSGASERLGYEVNPHVMDAGELRRRRESGDHFVLRVLESRKLFVVGDQDEHARLG